jgi:hypothetical protein
MLSRFPPPTVYTGVLILGLDFGTLKGLSHEIDFKNFDQKFTELGLNKGRGWFLNFLGGSNDFKMQKVYLLRLMPFCVGLTMVSCLFLSVPLITSRV